MDISAVDDHDGDFYADDVPFLDRAPLDVPDMDDPRAPPAVDAMIDPVEPEVSYKLLVNGSQMGKV